MRVNFSGVKVLCAVFCFAALFAKPAQAAIYWVGTPTPACQAASNVFSSLGAALVAVSASTENDEIRLTNTISYLGNSGETTFTDFMPGVTGSLIVSGGYADCDSPQSGTTIFGATNNPTFTVNTVTQARSFGTFRNIEIKDSLDRALFSLGGAEVVMENMVIHNNAAGILVIAGDFLDVGVDTVIRDNGPSGLPGGGIYCSDVNSQVVMRGRLSRNSTSLTGPFSYGGNIAMEQNCMLELTGGAIVEGTGSEFAVQADNGGGIYVTSGSELLASGGSELVYIRNNVAGDNGGGLLVQGTGRATLRNTLLNGNRANTGEGAALIAIDAGPGVLQVDMDRVAPCPNVITCSEISGSVGDDSIIWVANSLVDIQRTKIEMNSGVAGVIIPSPVIDTMVRVGNNGEIRLNAASINQNLADHLFQMMVSIRPVNPGKQVENMMLDSGKPTQT